MRMPGCLLLSVLAMLPALPLTSRADDIGELFRKVDLYGYGRWSYGKTDGNNYLGGTEDGTYDRATFALNATARLTDKFRVVGQISIHEGGGDHQGVALDYSFGEWAFSDAVKLKAGKVRQPFGVYTEVRDVGTLRPFLDLPQAVYGPIEATGVAYEGIGLSGTLKLNPDLDLDYDLYFGGLSTREIGGPEGILLGMEEHGGGGESESGPIHFEKSTDALGSRVRLVTPIPGLVFGFSALRAKKFNMAAVKQTRSVYGAEAQYIWNRVWITTEYVHENVKNAVDTNGWYVEVAVKPFDDHLQFAALGSGLDVTLSGADTSTPARTSLTQHDEWALGVNYWFSANFVLKASFHHVDGNRLSIPDAALLDEQVENGTLKLRTQLVLFGAQFSF